VISTTVAQTPLKYVRASLHTPVEVFVAVADNVVEAEKLNEGDLDTVTDEEAALVPVTDADSDLLFVLEPDSDLEVLTVTDGLLLSVGSAVVDADTLLLTVVVAVSVASMDFEAVVDGVKLGETGLFVTDGVTDGEGINSV
jgi:hypothetical protein